jgi:hypothetical protein
MSIKQKEVELELEVSSALDDMRSPTAATRPLDLPMAPEPPAPTVETPTATIAASKLDPRRSLPVEIVEDGPIMKGGRPLMYRLKILGVLWSTVEWKSGASKMPATDV